MSQAESEATVNDPGIKELNFKALRATQPIGDLYIAIMPARDLGVIANFDVRRVLQEERDVERYFGIQRPLSPVRVTELEKYVKFSDATFPTSIIIAISDEYAEYDEQNSMLIVRNYREGETVILNRTNGFRALMKILRPLFLTLGGRRSTVSVEQFLSELRRVPVESDHFNTVNYPPGSSGESKLKSDFNDWLGLDELELRIAGTRS
jgi:hypothetical protein